MEKNVNKQKRLVYIDFVRLFACICIVTVHFNASVSGFETFRSFYYPNSIAPNYYLGAYLGDIGVSLFFMVSGSSLMISNGSTGLKKFYQKRFFSIYPTFWVAYISATLLSFFLNKGMTLSNSCLLIFSLLGLDGYFGSLGLIDGSFYQVGEWFLGCIVLIYLLWPLLKKGLNNGPIITWTISLGICIYFSYKIQNTWFFLRLPEILFGMSIVKYKIAEKPIFLIGGTALIATIAYVLFLKGIINSLLWTISFCALLFSFLVYLSHFIKSQTVIETLVKISGFTYPVFLVHHWIINRLVQNFDLAFFPIRYTISLFIIYVVITGVAAFLLKKGGNILTEVLRDRLNYNVYR